MKLKSQEKLQTHHCSVSEGRDPSAHVQVVGSSCLRVSPCLWGGRLGFVLAAEMVCCACSEAEQLRYCCIIAGYIAGTKLVR